VSPDTIRRVRERAAELCEYCQLPAALHPAPFQIDHIVAKQHGGRDDIDNLALACIHCNRHKGPNVAGIDSETGELTRLFNPRADDWNSHFRWASSNTMGAEIIALSLIGRVTVSVLFMTDPEVAWLRSTLAAEKASRER
jgi:hypothetical protein